jgi:hypothetical protein
MNTKTMALAALALLALAAGAAAQTEADCDRSVKNCRQCRYQFFRGTTTKVRGGLLGGCAGGRDSAFRGRRRGAPHGGRARRARGAANPLLGSKAVPEGSRRPPP